ncbi:MAG: 3-dehydroquinate dehydratase [Flavobacteriales bacterium]|jgi:3-dehydroquinate dehydratase-2|nr:3-dehydroquinate dehydratase [Flavobacteriales bacterium]
MKKIIIINGPNLNLIGKREPKIYGNSSMEDYLSEIRNNFPEIQIDYFHSNVEGDLINKLQEVGFSYDGVVLNAGGYTHTSVAISDAVAAIQTSVVEVHISNVYKREDYRHQSLMAKNCIGIVAGFGLHSYKMAIDSFL